MFDRGALAALQSADRHGANGDFNIEDLASYLAELLVGQLAEY